MQVHLILVLHGLLALLFIFLFFYSCKKLSLFTFMLSTASSLPIVSLFCLGYFLPPFHLFSWCNSYIVADVIVTSVLNVALFPWLSSFDIRKIKIFLWFLGIIYTNTVATIKPHIILKESIYHIRQKIEW